MSSPSLAWLGRAPLAAALMSLLLVTACGGDDPVTVAPAAVSACGNKTLASAKTSCPPSAASAAAQ